MEFYYQLQEIETQLTKICQDKGITRDQLYIFSNFTSGEQLVIMSLLRAKYQLVREEILTMDQKFTNIVSLDRYRMKKILQST